MNVFKGIIALKMVALLGIYLLMGVNMAGFAAEKEVPATLGAQDSGNMLPVALFKGRVSNQPTRYILGPGDKLSITIRDLEKFNQKLTVRPDGYATIHPFGETYVAGTDIQGLQTWLEEKFRFYLVDPNVTLDIEEMRPALIYVTGAVQRPGTYQFIREGLNNYTLANPIQEKVEITLTNVLSKAGGVSEYADVTNIKVNHASTGEVETFNLRSLLTSGMEKEIWLLPGDTITVPQMDTPMDPETFKLVSRSTFYKAKFPVVVLGAVQKQGEVQVDPTNNTLNAAIALAGGFLQRVSKTDEIILQRPTNQGGFNRWVINRSKSNIELQPGDVVFIADNKVAKIERGLELLSKLTQPMFYASSGTYNLKLIQNIDELTGN